MQPSKYTNLLRARHAGCHIPETLLLSEETLKKNNLSAIDALLADGHQAFIIRSAVQSEDGATTSQAGYFYSPGPITAEKLREQIANAYQENRARADKISAQTVVNLMVSPFIEAEVGGIAFSPWLYFYGHSLIEYADTPQAAVAGANTTPRILAHDPEFRDTNETPPFAALSGALAKLQAVFTERIDVEWCYANETLYILQVRPVILAPTATKTVTLDELAANPESDFSSDLVRDTYAQELGKLSPLSVELLNRLYTNAINYRDTLDIIGNTAFLERLPTGEVFTRSAAYTAYMKDRHFYSAFVRGYKRKSVLQALAGKAKVWTAPKTVSLAKIQEAFSNWHIAQAFEALTENARAVQTYAEEYEISKRDFGNIYNKQNLTSKWKAHFMQSLIPLKNQVAQDPRLAWTPLDTVLESARPSSDWSKAYMLELPTSTCAVHLEDSMSEGAAVVISGKGYSGPALVIRDPQSWHGAIARNRVIVTPYIPTSWISELPHISGIIVVSLGQLSHAAIVLRENNVPAMTISQDAFAKISDGQEVSVR